MNGQEVETGDTIRLTDAQALYERDLGKIRATDAQDPPPVVIPEVLGEDVLTARRLGGARPFTVADLEEFLLTPGRPIAAALAALIGGQPPAVTTGTLDFSVAANSGLIAAIAA